MIGTPPVKTPFDDESGNPDGDWIIFMGDVYKGVQATQSSGPTANRPKNNLFIGRYYFDTSLGALGKPIYIGKDGKTWITADGALA